LYIQNTTSARVGCLFTDMNHMFFSAKTFNFNQDILSLRWNVSSVTGAMFYDSLRSQLLYL
jgi:hypothetical protein